MNRPTKQLPSINITGSPGAQVPIILHKGGAGRWLIGLLAAAV